MSVSSRTILIVDDEAYIRTILREKLSKEGYHCLEAGNSEQTLEQLKEGTPALIILDNKLPGRWGVDLLPEIRSTYPETAVIMITGNSDSATAIKCLKLGAHDYFYKPFNLDEIVLGVQRALEKRWLELENKDYHQHLEEKVAEQTRKIRSLFLSAITSLVNALEAKDLYTSGHSQRVAEIAVAIAREKRLPELEIDEIHLAGLVHDVGKIGIRERILNKNAYLTDEEKEHVHTHPEIGARILTPIADNEGIIRLVMSHHEHYDGTGYPDGLKRDEIPVGARILAVADAFEAMTSERPYRNSFDRERAIEEMENCKGSQFDPEIVDIFIKVLRESNTLWKDPVKR